MGRQAKKQRGVYEYPKASGVWWVVFYDQIGKRHREKVGPRGLAVEVYRKRKTEVREAKFFPESVGRAGTIQFRKIASAYVEYAVKNGKYMPSIERHVKFWTKVLGDRPADTITPDDIESVKQRLIEGHEPGTVNRYIGTLRAIYYRSMIDPKTRVKTNPAAFPKKRGLFLTEDNDRVRYLSEDERAKLLSACDTENIPLIRIAWNTGIRLTGLTSLRWGDADFHKRTITVRENKGGKTYEVPMNSEVYEILWGLRLRVIRRVQVRDAGNVTTLPSGQIKELPIFPAWFGRAVHYLSNFFRRLAKRAGVDDVHFHDLRHDFASRLAMAGVPLAEIGKLLGHSPKSLSLVLRYAHFSPDHMKSAVEKLSDVKVGDPTAIKTATEGDGKRR
ncbi:MAG: site-specific integrase [Nitrospirae bacterium]|nr:site-specific integrase [Nitrospirota bacterium]